MKDLSTLSVEVESVSYIITGLVSNLDNENADRLYNDKTQNAMFGVASYLDRIAGDMDKLLVKKD